MRGVPPGCGASRFRLSTGLICIHNSPFCVFWRKSDNDCIHIVSNNKILEDTMPTPFPMNAWYAAAWDAEIKHALWPRTICGKHVVMYRKADGSVAALEDACWHRLVPLSKGRLEGDTVVCGYHG